MEPGQELDSADRDRAQARKVRAEDQTRTREAEFRLIRDRGAPENRPPANLLSRGFR